MNLAETILSTLRYSDHFGFPLKLEELHSRLIGVKSSKAKLTRELQNLLAIRRIEYSRGFYFLPRRSPLISKRLRRARTSTKLIKRAHSLAPHLAHVPGVLAIYLTGSLAMQNAKTTADIDFMIITHPNRLWTTRLLLTLYTSFLGLRRTPYTTHKDGKLCLNLYMTPNSYLLIPDKQSLYTAYELIQAIPLYDPHNTHIDLLAANPWITNFLPNYSFPKTKNPSFHGSTTPRLYTKLLESLCYQLQLAYMRRKITREYITPHSAFFHPHDPRPKVK